MANTRVDIETITWLGIESDTHYPRTPTPYTLIESYSMDPAQSPKHNVVDAVLDVTNPPAGQTTLTLYEHIAPDALDDLIDKSEDKQSSVEVRFTIDEYLIVVRSTGALLVYEPLRAH